MPAPQVEVVMSRTKTGTDWYCRHTAAFRRRLLRGANFAGMGVCFARCPGVFVAVSS